VTALARYGTLGGVLLVGLSCGTADRPTSPTPIPPAVTVQPQPPVQPLPTVPVPAGSTRYDFSGPLTYSVRSYTTTSAYVLNPAGSFALHYPSLSATPAYVGTYQQDGDRIRFRFSGDGRWDAEGTLNGDSLTVRYNIIMEMSDFENATYKRAQ
jgi:hypothetical protein